MKFYAFFSFIHKKNFFKKFLFFRIMPAMDLALIDKLGRDLHSHSPGYMGEDEVCPWTLFLTMALTLLKG